MKNKIFIIALLFTIITLVGCKNSEYYNDEDLKVKSKYTISGNDTLTLSQGDTITLENEKVRIILNKDGSIREYANKESHLYLVKDMMTGIPVRINKQNSGYQEYSSYSFEVVENNDEEVICDDNISKDSIVIVKKKITKNKTI